VLVESQGCHVVAATPMLRHRPRPRLRDHLSTGSSPSHALCTAPAGKECPCFGFTWVRVAAFPTQCAPLRRGRGVRVLVNITQGFHVVVAVPMLWRRPRPRLRVFPATRSSRRRCRPDAPASALAAVAGLPVFVESQGFHVVVAATMLRHRPRLRLRGR